MTARMSQVGGETSSGATLAAGERVSSHRLTLTWQGLREWYFRPRRFERWGSAFLYRMLGVRYFKRYVPTSGDLVSRWRGTRRIRPGGRSARARLLAYEAVTRDIEWSHLGGFLAMGGGILLTADFLDSSRQTILWALNVAINVYPIFLQRYNRCRILRILQSSA